VVLMVKNLDAHSRERLKEFKDKVKKDNLSVEETCLIEIAGALMILADKIGKRLP